MKFARKLKTLYGFEKEPQESFYHFFFYIASETFYQTAVYFLKIDYESKFADFRYYYGIMENFRICHFFSSKYTKE